MVLGGLDTRLWNLAPVAFSVACGTEAQPAAVGEPCNVTADCEEDSYCFGGTCTRAPTPLPPGCSNCNDNSSDYDDYDDYDYEPPSDSSEPGCTPGICGPQEVCVEGFGPNECVYVDFVPPCDPAPLPLPIEESLPSGESIRSLTFLEAEERTSLVIGRVTTVDILEVDAEGVLNAGTLALPQPMQLAATGDINGDAVPDMLFHVAGATPRLMTVLSTPEGHVVGPEQDALPCESMAVGPWASGESAGVACLLGDQSPVVTPIGEDGLLGRDVVGEYVVTNPYAMTAMDAEFLGRFLVVASPAAVTGFGPNADLIYSELLLGPELGTRQLAALRTDVFDWFFPLIAVTPMSDWTLIETGEQNFDHPFAALPFVFTKATAGDVEGDGDDDLIVQGPDGLTVVRHTSTVSLGEMPLTCRYEVALPFSPTSWAFGDLERDGQPELIAAQGDTLARFVLQ